MKNKTLYRLRVSIASIIFILSLLGIFGVFYSIKIFDIQFMPVFQRLIIDFSIPALVIFLALVGLTLCFGRIYCSLLCPFGILQEFIGCIKHRFIKNKSSKQVNSPIKYFVAAIAWGMMIGGTAFIIRYIDPYTNFGSAFSLSAAGLILLGVVLVAVILKDRIFCTNFCPVGTVLGLVSKLSLNKIYLSDKCVSCGMCERNCPSGCIDSKNKTVDNETCIKCLKCLTLCPQQGIIFGKTPDKTTFNPKRREFIIASAALAVFAGMIKAGIDLKDKVAAKIKDVILPAGAVSKERFLNKCLNCNLCVKNCPNKIIKKADAEYGAVHLDYSKGECKFDCHKCSEVCPSGAIKKISLEEKQHTRIGMAMINEEQCENCGLCAEVCPVHAIMKIDGKLILNASKCIGCGACKNACHFNAIEVFGVNEQRTL